MYQGHLSQLLQSVRTKARADGAQNLPSSNATVPSEQENQIAAEARRCALEATSTLDKEMIQAKAAVEGVLGKVEQTAQQCDSLIRSTGLEAEARLQLAKTKDKLSTLKAAELRRLADLRAFRAEHELTREATYPSDRFLSYAWLSAFVVLEGIFNAYFFRNDTGLLGGFLLAISVSGINVSAAAYLGFRARERNHRSTARKVFGWALLPIFLLWATYFNAVISGYRSSLQRAIQLGNDASEFLSQVRAFHDAVKNAVGVFSLDWPFADLESFILFFLGLLLAGLAWWKGYELDDPYPGYGEVHRKWAAAEAAVAPEFVAVRQMLSQSMSTMRAEVVDARSRLLTDAARVVQLSSSVTTAVAECNTQLAAIQNDFAALEHSYRQTNTQVRSTPPPQYFSQPQMPFVLQHDGGSSIVLALLTEAKRQYQSLTDRFIEPLETRAQLLLSEATTLEERLYRAHLDEVKRNAEEIIAHGHPTLSAPPKAT